MIITNLNLRNKLNITKYMEADTGVGEGAEGVVEDNADDTKDNNDTKEKKTFTQDQVEEMIKERLARETKKLEKQYKDRLSKDIEDGMTEAKKYDQMTKQEKAEYDYNKRLEALEKREKEANLRDMRASATKTLTSKEYGYSGDSVESLLGLLNYDSAEEMDKSIKSIHSIINSIVQNEVNKVAKTKMSPSSTSTNSSSVNLNALRKKLNLPLK